MSHRTSSLTLLLVLFAALPFAAMAQEEVQKKSKVQDNLEFAMEMARFRYFDLANAYVDKIKKGHMTDADQATLLLTNAQILRWAAEFSLSKTDRADFYQRAISRFKEFTDYNTAHPDYPKARIDLAVLYQDYGQFLSFEMRATGDPERKKEIKETAETSFRDATLLFNEVTRELNKLAEAYQSNGQDEEAETTKRQASEAAYKKGVAYFNWAAIYDADDFNRDDYLQRTVDTLDEYIWEAEENDFWALWAYLYQSKAYTELGEFVQALDLAMQIYDVETGVSLEDPEKKKLADNFAKLAPEFLQMFTDLVESAYYQVALIQNKQAEYEKAVSAVNEMKALFSRCELSLSEIGDSSLLAQAEAYKKIGKKDLAAEVAKEVADRNPGRQVGKDAKVFLQNLIQDSIDAPGGGGDIDPSILFTAAEGAFLDNDFYQAITGYYRVLKVLKTVDQEKEYIAKSWNGIGKSYNKLIRPLEASIAFQTGFYSKYAKADNDMYESNGNHWYMACGKRFRETNHSYDEKTMKSARDTLVNAGVSTDLLFFIAKEKFDKAQGAKGEERSALMTEAIESFLDVKKTSKYYEKSLIYLARCYQDLAQYDKAITRLDEFDRYVRTSPPPATPKQKGARQGAMAEALFYRAEIYITQEKFQEAFKILVGFEDTFKSQDGFFDATLYFRILAKLGSEEFPEAERLFKELTTTFEKSNRVSFASYRIGKAFVVAAEKERGDKEKEPSEKYLEYLKKGADYMYRYCEISGWDSFVNLKNVADWYKELGENKTACDAYERLLEEFGKVEEYKEEIRKSVNRSYGEILLRLKEFQKAKMVWLRLLNGDKKNPTFLRCTARCLGGWLEFDGYNFIEIPGSGDYLPAADADPKKITLNNALGIWGYLLKALKVNKAYTDEWWEAKLFTVYCYYKAGEQDAACYDTVLKHIDNVELYHPDLGGSKYKPSFKYLEKATKQKKRQR
jgi:hypothetical protein